jgi:pimeloyl-ACP methyl ester carboxylesterase
MTDNPKEDKDYNIQGEIDHLYGFIQTLKLGKVHVVGQSRGSELALFYAVQHPDTLRMIVLCDTSAALPPVPFTRPMALAHCSAESRQGQDNGSCGENAQTFTYTQSIDRSFVDATFGDEFWAAANYMRGLPKAKVTAAKMKAGAGAPLAEDGAGSEKIIEWKTEQINRIKNEAILQMPVLVYWGRNDPVANWPLGWQLYDALAEKDARVRLLTVNKAGHFHFREYPEDFNSNVIGFIDYWEHRPETGLSSAQAK